MRDRLWKAANKLRGQVDAAAYRHVVLALLFLRFVASGKTPVQMPTGFAPRKGALDEAFAAVERANPALRGALPRGLDALQRVDEILALLDGVAFEASRDRLGEVYEYFLDRFARTEGRRGGQFYTPRGVVRLLAALAGPGRTVYDPCCGSGGMLVQGAAYESAFGQESNAGSWRLARLNLALHGLSADLGERPADSFLDDLHAGRRADVVLANPPFNQSDWSARKLEDDPRFVYGRPPEHNANFAWLQHVLAHLAPDGTAAVVTANGALSATKAGEGAIRRALVEAGRVDAIVALPAKLFYSTPIPACVWVLARARPDTVLFVDARGLGRKVARARTELGATEVERIAGAYRAYRAGDEPFEPGFAAVARGDAIAAQRHVLTPARYVAPPARRGAEPARARLERLAGEWSALAAEAERLAAEIREAGLG